ncbi:MAG: hypothetical protein ACYC4R_09345 [Anaerolineae bacterium]
MVRTPNARDRDILRGLAARQAEIAALPVHRETVSGWERLNALGIGKPMVWINEIPWHEMDVDGELTLQCADPFCRAQEETLRRTLYQWRHMRGDMVVEPLFYCPLVVHDTGFGIQEEVDIARTDAASDVVSRHFHLQIQCEADLAKIQMPQVTHDVEATARNHQTLEGLFGDLLPIVVRGAPGFWFAPWDELIRWWGVREAMEDLVLRPELVHAAMDRLVGAYLHRLDQYEAQNLLAFNNGNVRIGSGGLGYCTDLPQPDANPARPRPIDLWGCGTAQIFSDVSPAMHEEFALQYERRWMGRFGLNYYGCCEPLHLKLGVLASIPRLRKVSMSPWANVARAAPQVAGRYVFSHKPSPAFFAQDIWRPEQARQALVDVLERPGGCAVEVIMKDVSTVRYAPQRLWDWAAMAAEVTARYAA